MPNDFGVSFVPGQDQQQQQSGVNGGPPSSPIQSAIKLLSLRLPRVVGANALAPQGLLQSPGGAGLPSGFPGSPGFPSMAPSQPSMAPPGLLRGPGVPGAPGQPSGGGMTLEEILRRLFGGGGGLGGPLPSLPPPRITPGQEPEIPSGRDLQPLPGFDPSPREVDRTQPGLGNRPPGDPALVRPPTDAPQSVRWGALNRLSRGGF